MDLEAIGLDMAGRGFFLDLRRVLANHTTLAAKWECRLQAFGDYDGDTPYGEGKTAIQAIRRAKAKLPPRGLFGEPA
jgi:hypothetical protein